MYTAGLGASSGLLQNHLRRLMLNSNSLASDFKSIFDDVLQPAIESAMRSMTGEETENSIKTAEMFAENLTEMLSKPLADRLAATIDHYIKSGQLSGTIITAGSPFTQTAVIVPDPMGMATSGKIPNTLGIM